MFENKRINKLNEEFQQFKSSMRDQLTNLKENLDLVSCETCGCAVHRSKATKGDSVLRKTGGIFSKQEYVLRKTGGIFSKQEYVYQPYFCKTHAPTPKDTVILGSETPVNYINTMKKSTHHLVYESSIETNRILSKILKY